MRVAAALQVLVLAAPAATAQGEPLTLRVGLHDAEPFAYRDEDGRAHGFVIEVLEHVAAREGWRLEYAYGTWAECLARLERAEIDLLCPILRTPERERIADFTRESMFSTWGCVFARPSAGVGDLFDLDGRTVAVVEGDYFGDALRALARGFAESTEFLPLATPDDVLRACAQGRADACALERLAGTWLLRDTDLDNTPVIFEHVSPLVAVPRGRHRAVLSALDRQLSQLKADRSSAYHRAYEEWFGHVGPRPFPVWLLALLATTLGLLAAMSGFSAVLRARVASRTRELSERNAALEAEVAERRRVETFLRQAQRREALGRMASGVAHELRNLLAVIWGHAERVRSLCQDNEEVLDSLRTMDQSVEHASGLARSLLTFSREQPSARQEIDLSALLHDTGRLLERSLPRSIEIRVVAPADGPWVRGDPRQIQQVLVNLGFNARDAMPRGGRLVVRAEAQEPERAVVSVRDSGRGMDPQTLARVFEPYFTTKDEEHGTGLGLFTARSIVEDHGGELRVESAPERGTTFTIVLPRVDPPAAAAGAPLEASEPEHSGPAGAGSPAPAAANGALAVAVRARQVREVVAGTLRHFGRDLRLASDVDELRRQLAGGRVELVVLDAQLAPGELPALVAEMRRGAARTLPVVILSGGTDPEVRDAVVLRKPFQMAELERVAARLLEQGDGEGARS